MAINMSVAVRTNMVNTIEGVIAANGYLHVNSGAVPANCAAGGSGTLLCNIALGTNFFADAANGAVAKGTTWQGTAVANGTAGHWRIYATDGTTCHLQGNCTNTGGGGDMTLDNVSIATNQTVTVTTFTLTAGNP